MKMKWHFPIRFKILLTGLVVITAVVGVITFTMARLFHIDKTAYIHDLTSVITLNTAEETRTILTGYRERLQVFTRFLYEDELRQDQKTKLLQQLFKDFHEFIAVTLHEPGKDPITIYDAYLLKSVGLEKKALLEYRRKNPLPMDEIRSGKAFVENSTISDALPSLTIAIAHKTPEGKNAVVSAVIRLDNLLRLAQRSKVFETFIVDSRGKLLLHSDRQLVAKRSHIDWIPQLKDLQKEESLSRTMEYVQNGAEMVAGFARVEFGDLVAGVQIRKAMAYLTARELLKNLMLVSLLLLLIAVIASLFWSKRITRPIELLSMATRQVGQGEFEINVDSTSHDEIGDLANSFNTMISELNVREKALMEAQDALVHSGKMSAFGQLGAGIAHEVKNPLAGILGYTQLSLRKIEKGDPLRKNLEIIEKETKRCRTIIDNLMKFARQDKSEKRLTDINLVVNDALAIVDHQLTINNVALEKELASNLPDIMANASQIQQVLMNLMINAQQAMAGDKGRVRISTRLLDGIRCVEVSVSDTGPGMTKEVREKIFDPFFTTKAVGQGTGLGLSVSYGILKDHDAEIVVDSAPGEGSTFILRFPLAEPGEKEEPLDKDERKTA